MLLMEFADIEEPFCYILAGSRCQWQDCRLTIDDCRLIDERVAVDWPIADVAAFSIDNRQSTIAIKKDFVLMKLTLADWLVVAAYFLINLLIGLYYRKKASASTDDFFVSGREVSWWLAGTSMVATTFAADTPLWVTGQVVRRGVAANWFWWSFLLSGMMTVFFFARMWRRAEIITDVELVELRYAGKPAAFLRGFRALYFGVLINCIILGWVNLAMEKILGISLNIPKFWAVVICMAITAIYTSISGLWGVLWTDLVQFILKMGMLILLAFYAVRAVGGMSALKTKLAAVDAARGAAVGGSGSILSFVPDLHSPWMPVMTFLVYIGVYWWSVWYPGAEPGGGGFVAQRIFCAKDEKNSLLATLWFNIAHYALRPWAWILTALTVVVLYPQLSLPGADAEGGFVRVWVDYLPGAFRGLMLAAFAAAYMSTMATQLNWGSSYLVNDFYRRFVARHRSDRHYVTVSKISTMGLMVVSAAVSYIMHTVAGGWDMVVNIGAGTGAVYLLRWYWWRINAWSEISAMATAAVVSIALKIRQSLPGFRPEPVRQEPGLDGDHHHRGVGGRHVPDATGAGIQTPGVLPPRAAGRDRMEAHRRAGAGNPSHAGWLV